MSFRWLLLFALLLLLTVMVRLPARWAAGALPAGIECIQPTGTVWSGGCSTLRRGALQLGPLRWHLQPMRLLRGELAAQLHSDDPRLRGRLQFSYSFNGALLLQDVQLSAALDSGLLPAMPANWNGSLQLALTQLRLQGYRLLGIDGVITMQQLRQLQPAIDFGSYELRFPAAAANTSPSVGQLRDLSGPLSVTGTVSVDSKRQYEVEGTVLARADVSSQLQRLIELLGPADDNGRRPFSLAGVY